MRKTPPLSRKKYSALRDSELFNAQGFGQTRAIQE
jgi:hypothetical protein